MTPDWQPTLHGKALTLRPLKEEDFEELFSAASDPLIWEQHPANNRYQREVFRKYFQGGLESRGAFAILDRETGKIIGSSRYTDYNPKTSSVEVGYTFLTRKYWGGRYNQELKSLMLDYAFQHVQTVYFVVGASNFRSREALLKIGASEVPATTETPVTGDLSGKVVFSITRP